MLRHMVVRTWVLVVAVAVPLTACAANEASVASEPSNVVERAAVRPAGDGREEAVAIGVLRGDSKSGCLWLEQRADGSVGPQLLLYGEEYRVDFSTEPASIRDGDDVVARVGERVEVGGGFGADDGVSGCPVSAPSFVGYF